MAKQCWLVLDRKKIIGILVVFLLALGIIGCGIIYYEKINISSEELLDAAMDKTLNFESMGFNLQVKMGGSIITDVQGVRKAPDSVHITGTMQKMPVELIHLEDQTFLKGHWSEQWITLGGANLSEAELFIAELNPLRCFDYQNVSALKERRKEKEDGISCRVMEFKPIVRNELMELSYEDFEYCLWIDPGNQVIKKVFIQAKGKNGKKDKLELTLKLKDFNQPVEIKTPEL